MKVIKTVFYVLAGVALIATVVFIVLSVVGVNNLVAEASGRGATVVSSPMGLITLAIILAAATGLFLGLGIASPQNKTSKPTPAPAPTPTSTTSTKPATSPKPTTSTRPADDTPKP